MFLEDYERALRYDVYVAWAEYGYDPPALLPVESGPETIVDPKPCLLCRRPGEYPYCFCCDSL